jgi:hypothetical protein
VLTPHPGNLVLKRKNDDRQGLIQYTVGTKRFHGKALVENGGCKIVDCVERRHNMVVCQRGCKETRITSY